MHHLRRHSRSTNERTKHILALNDGPATSNHFTSMWTVQHRVESTTKVKLRIVRCMYAFVRVKRMRVCVRAAAAWDWAQHSFVHLLLTRQRWCDAMIENIHSVVTHSKTLYRLFRSGHFACDICYLWFCTRGDVLFAGHLGRCRFINALNASGRNRTKMHITRVCARMRNTTFDSNEIHFPNIYSYGSDPRRPWTRGYRCSAATMVRLNYE